MGDTRDVSVVNYEGVARVIYPEPSSGYPITRVRCGL